MFRSELEFGAKYRICCVKPDWEEKQYTGTLVALIERGRKLQGRKLLNTMKLMKVVNGGRV